MDDGRRDFDGQPVGSFAELFRHLLVRQVVDQQHRGLGDPGGPFLDLDAKEMVESDLYVRGDIE